jgi:crotonobetainyl-CoA:carnitine CoA-transferase CaiB-like acyl-CoA transferase
VLDGMRVVSFCHYLQGPAAAQYLADMGADVIKVEPPGGAYERHWAGPKTFVDGVSSFYLCANRNKRSICIDLKHADAKPVVERLLATADVVMENFRPGVMARLGFSYERLQAIKPDIIYASATGFGASGPMALRPGQDLLIQAYSGLVSVTGQLDTRPTAVGHAAIDQHGAAILALGIAGAYVKKLKTGKGTRVEASLLNAGLDLQTEPLTIYMTRRLQAADGRRLMSRNENLATWFHEAPYGIYRCADAWLALSINDTTKLARAIGSEELAALAGCDRYDERDRLAEVVAAALAGQTFAALQEGFDREAIWYQRVHEYDDLPDDPQISHCQVFREVEVKRGRAILVNHPNRYDGEVPPLRHLALEIGADSRAVLDELGYASGEIEALLASGAIHAPGAVTAEITSAEADA